jgi:hypothetical protein
MSSGSSAIPTAERPCRPTRSPNTSTRRSEHPSMTAAVWLHPGAQLTMPNTFKIDVTLSDEPISARSEANRNNPVARAASELHRLKPDLRPCPGSRQGERAPSQDSRRHGRPRFRSHSRAIASGVVVQAVSRAPGGATPIGRGVTQPSSERVDRSAFACSLGDGFRVADNVGVTALPGCYRACSTTHN